MSAALAIQPGDGSTLSGRVAAFAARREAQIRDLTARHNSELPEPVWAYFKAAREGNWAEVSRLWEALRDLTCALGVPRPHPDVTCLAWASLLEIRTASDEFALSAPKYALAFGQGIIDSIPPGSVYFGGTDAGRGLVTVLSKSQETGDPFFTVTQNAFGDSSYLRYLRNIYGAKIAVPSEQEAKDLREGFLQDLRRRKEENKLKPGEEFTVVNGEVQPSGPLVVMGLNGLMTRFLFDRNPQREFFVEESFPLEWMFPHLVPHGLIMKIAREPLPTIAPEEIEKDHAFWMSKTRTMLGEWLRRESTLDQICAFAERIFLRKELAGFDGDPQYVTHAHAGRVFSKLRSAIAGLYSWRARNAADPAEKKRMTDVAEFAFRQALAFYPVSPEVVFRYVNLLITDSRLADALQVGRLAAKIDPTSPMFQSLVQQLEQHQRRRER